MACEVAEPSPAPFEVAHTQCRQDAGRYHGDCKADPEAQHQREAEAELLELYAE